MIISQSGHTHHDSQHYLGSCERDNLPLVTAQ